MNNNLYLVDTSAWIHALRKDSTPLIRERIAQLLSIESIMITDMIKLELLGGTKTEKEFSRLKNRLDSIDTIPINSSVWDESFNLAFKLRRHGITVPYTDILIAACALKSGAVLLHCDAHFEMIAKKTTLKTESHIKLVS
jgi:predicted nucleic acid-binding protein